MTLYKYLPPERLDVLRAKEVRVTQASAENDPFELNAYFDLLFDEDGLVRQMTENPVDMMPHLEAAYDRLPEESRAQVPRQVFLSFATASITSPDGSKAMRATLATVLAKFQGLAPVMRDQLNEALGSRIGILSLSLTPTGDALWAQYAAGNRGYVIGFDERHDFFNRKRSPDDEFYHIRPVVYGAPVPTAAMEKLDWQIVLCGKHPDWSWEQEVRMFVPVEHASRAGVGDREPMYFETFPERAVTEVILGAKASQEFADTVRQILRDPRYSHVGVRRAHVDRKYGEITIAPSP